MTLIAASWPSKSEAAVTTRSGAPATSAAGVAVLDGDARHPTPSSRKERVSLSISRAITIRWISCVPS